MLLYTEKQLDSAYRVDCKARTSCNKPWIIREQFRPVYEKLIELYMQAYISEEEIYSEIPEYLLDSVNDLLESTLILET